MRKLLSLIVLLVSTLLSLPSYADAPKGCDGPPELCQQILDLNQKLADSKAASVKKMDKKIEETKVVEDGKKEERMAKLIASAAILAVGLKMLLSLLQSWKGYFSGSKGKAALKLTTLLVGFVAFLATNIGLGIPWWQALVLAGGGPGAILVHDLSGIIPVLMGKKTDIPPDLMSDRPPAGSGPA